MLRVGRVTSSLTALLVFTVSCSPTRAVDSSAPETVIVSDSHGNAKQINVRIQADARHASVAFEAARTALERYARWFGLPPDGDLTMTVDPGFASNAIHAVEQVVVVRVAERWWTRVQFADDWEDGLREGFLNYLGGFVLEELYNARFGVAGRLPEQVPLLEGTVTYRLPRLALGRGVVTGSDSAARIERTLLTIEGLIGLTAMERALYVIVKDWQGALTVDGLITTIGTIAGRDLSGIRTLARDRSELDLSVREIDSHAFTVARRGLAAWRNIPIAVRFADGQQLTERWSGTEVQRYEYESPAPIVAVHIDPEHTVVMDENRINNVVRVTQDAPVAVTPWVARWVGWMQNLLLSSALVL